MLGALLLMIGLAGVLSLGALSASAEERSTEHSHAVMHEMMDTVHGAGTSARMHRVEGAEEMMERSDMMSMMGSMDRGMMHEIMPDDMMGGGMMEIMQR